MSVDFELRKRIKSIQEMLAHVSTEEPLKEVCRRRLFFLGQKYGMDFSLGGSNDYRNESHSGNTSYRSGTRYSWEGWGPSSSRSQSERSSYENQDSRQKWECEFKAERRKVAIHLARRWDIRLTTIRGRRGMVYFYSTREMKEAFVSEVDRIAREVGRERDRWMRNWKVQEQEMIREKVRNSNSPGF